MEFSAGISSFGFIAQGSRNDSSTIIEKAALYNSFYTEGRDRHLTAGIAGVRKTGRR